MAQPRTIATSPRRIRSQLICLTVTVTLLLWLFSFTTTLDAQSIEGTQPESERVESTAWTTNSQLFIHVAIENEWHIYAPGSKAGVPFAIKMMDESDFELNGEVHVVQDAKGVVSGNTTIRVPIKKKGDGNQLQFYFDYQACDALECNQPERLEFMGKVEQTGPQRVLLLVDADNERAQRIKTLIEDSGIQCTVKPYADDLTSNLLDAFDVVVTDCPGFRNSRSGLDAVKDFPKTQTPILASGFLGTQLIENHQLAMTSGYI